MSSCPATWLPEVLAELARAREAHPDPTCNALERCALLMEEAGEVQQAVNDHHFSGKPWGRVHAEAIQVIAMCVRLLEDSVDRGSHV